MNKNIILYGHGGSCNHGCEAIIRSLAKILEHYGLKSGELMSLKPKEDEKYDLHSIIVIKDVLTKHTSRTDMKFISAYIKMKFFNQYEHHHTVNIVKQLITYCQFHLIPSTMRDKHPSYLMP